MTYEVTATRKRPRNFDELVGQEFVVSTLKNSIEQGKIAHAYLFAGPRGVGKTSAARILAKALNCEKGPTSKPCGKCSLCVEIAQGNSLDVIEIDGASNTSVNDVREIKDEVLFPPNSSRYKVYIIDEIHMLSNSAFNALLKTIEEPPPYIVFIFATTEIHKVPPTIRSRCQQYHFRQISTDIIKNKLEELVKENGIKAESEALFWIAKEASGSLRDAYTIFDQVVSFSSGNLTMQNIKDTLGTIGTDEINILLTHVINKEAKQAFQYLDKLLQSGISVEQFIIDLSDYFRSLLLLKNGITRESLLGYTSSSFPDNIVSFFDMFQLEKILEELFRLYRNLRFSLNQKMELELFISLLLKIDQMINPTEILEKLKELKEGVVFQKTESEQQTQENTKAISGDSGNTTTTIDSSNILGQIAASLKKEKPTVSSALEQCSGTSLQGDTFTIRYRAKNRFAGEMILKEKPLIADVLNRITGKDYRVEIEFIKHDNSKEQETDRHREFDRDIETVKRIFRGEIVK